MQGYSFIDPSNKTIRQLYDEMEDSNLHSECKILEALCLGDEDE